MVSIFGPLLASAFVLISDCKGFWDVDHISQQTEISWDGSSVQPLIDFEQLQGKKVLLMVHGFNNSSQEAIDTFHLIEQNLDPTLYDVLIGYIWPGYASRLEYLLAREHADELAFRVRQNVNLLSGSVGQLDVLAHSLGNRLVFQALDYTPSSSLPVQNFYSLAPAVDDETIEIQNQFFYSTQNCQDLYIFHSRHDDALKIFYPMAEFDAALGSRGVEDLSKLPENVQLIDCSALVDGHSAYFTTPSVYAFFKDHTPSPVLQNVKLLADGSVAPITN